MNLCVNCGYGMGSAAKFCGMCGVVMPMPKEPISEDEILDTEQWRLPDANGICSDFFHGVIMASEGWCVLCKTSCARVDHSRHQKSAYEYCPECGVKLRKSAPA